jgi:drug/metabolite transporter (DMT)-like permease
MNERVGVLAAILSSTFGGMAAAVTRYVIGAIDPVTIAAFRFGLGFLFLLPIALLVRSRWPVGRDWIGAALLGLFFFAFFFVLYNLSLGYTTAARGTLALSTLPLLTMLVAAAVGAEAMTLRKSAGVAIAMAGVAFALLSELGSAPAGAWRGDLLMIGGTLCMAFYNVWARPFMARSSPLGLVTVAMGFGGGAVTLVAGASGGFAVVSEFSPAQWIAMLYLGLLGGALAFYLWNFALERTTPTRVANTLTVNPIAAAILATFLLGEPIGFNLIVGIAGVFAGIWIVSTDPRKQDHDGNRLVPGP